MVAGVNRGEITSFFPSSSINVPLSWSEHPGLRAADCCPEYLATELRGKGQHRLIFSVGINERLYGTHCLILCHSMKPGPFEEAQQHFSGVVPWFEW